MSNNQQITSTGIPQQSGLETFSSIITYDGEFINWGNAFNYVTQLGSDTDYSSNAENPLTDALINSPATVLNEWYRYHTDGSLYTTVSAPISTGGYFIFNGQKVGSKVGYSGMYQKLVLTVGKEYEVTIQNTINANSGKLYVKTFTPSSNDFIESSSSYISFPISKIAKSYLKYNFTAYTANDIIVLYFTTTSASITNVSIVDISIKEKQEYIVPVYANDMYGNAHNVLRLNAGNRLSNV